MPRKAKFKVERLNMTVPAELKEKLEQKATKYKTDMTTLTRLILTSVLDQI